MSSWLSHLPTRTSSVGAWAAKTLGQRTGRHADGGDDRLGGLWGNDNDNDNDNVTLREVPHPSNEGLALQARV